MDAISEPANYLDTARVMFRDLADVRSTATWQVRQRDVADRATRFIYECERLEEVRSRLEAQLSKELLDYAEHRWRNYWRHDAWLNLIVGTVPRARPYEDPRHRTRDLYVPFRGAEVTTDLKVTRIPKGLDITASDEDLARHYYDNQSREQRHHLESRLFVVGEPELGLYDIELAQRTVRNLNLDDVLFEIELAGRRVVTGIVRHGPGWTR